MDWILQPSLPQTINRKLTVSKHVQQGKQITIKSVHNKIFISFACNFQMYLDTIQWELSCTQMFVVAMVKITSNKNYQIKVRRVKKLTTFHAEIEYSQQ